jgi:16S rRNA (guanine(966)-N(2))-methyltransferase RsmD
VAPADLPVRPTTDLAKESLFNILNNYVDFESIEVLDLFSGTGNISYEFLSRGSPAVTSVDIESRCTGFISRMAEKLEFSNLHVIRAEVLVFLRSSRRQWDIIFADPPFGYEKIRDIAGLVRERDLLKRGGGLILEHPKETDLSDLPWFDQHRQYGRIHFSIFRKP